MHHSLRGTGITTEQMTKAPKDAVYVWCNHHFDYPRLLAKRLGRDDLTIMSPSSLLPFYIDGLARPLVLDYATVLTHQQLGVYQAHCMRYAQRFDNKDRKI
jgi:hypothetical protein